MLTNWDLDDIKNITNLSENKSMYTVNKKSLTEMSYEVA